MAHIQVVCPKCRSDQVFPTHIGDGAMCIPCGHEFKMFRRWWQFWKRH